MPTSAMRRERYSGTSFLLPGRWYAATPSHASGRSRSCKRSTGSPRYSAGPDCPVLDNRKVLRSMELMERHVIPHFKRSREDVGIHG